MHFADTSGSAPPSSAGDSGGPQKLCTCFYIHLFRTLDKNHLQICQTADQHPVASSRSRHLCTKESSPQKNLSVSNCLL